MTEKQIQAAPFKEGDTIIMALENGMAIITPYLGHESENGQVMSITVQNPFYVSLRDVPQNDGSMKTAINLMPAIFQADLDYATEPMSYYNLDMVNFIYPASKNLSDEYHRQVDHLKNELIRQKTGLIVPEKADGQIN